MRRIFLAITLMVLICSILSAQEIAKKGWIPKSQPITCGALEKAFRMPAGSLDNFEVKSAKETDLQGQKYLVADLTVIGADPETKAFKVVLKAEEEGYSVTPEGKYLSKFFLLDDLTNTMNYYLSNFSGWKDYYEKNGKKILNLAKEASIFLTLANAGIVTTFAVTSGLLTAPAMALQVLGYTSLLVGATSEALALIQDLIATYPEDYTIWYAAKKVFGDEASIQEVEVAKACADKVGRIQNIVEGIETVLDFIDFGNKYFGGETSDLPKETVDYVSEIAGDFSMVVGSATGNLFSLIGADKAGVAINLGFDLGATAFYLAGNKTNALKSMANILKKSLSSLSDAGRATAVNFVLYVELFIQSTKKICIEIINIMEAIEKKEHENIPEMMGRLYLYTKLYYDAMEEYYKNQLRYEKRAKILWVIPTTFPGLTEKLEESIGFAQKASEYQEKRAKKLADQSLFDDIFYGLGSRYEVVVESNPEGLGNYPYQFWVKENEEFNDTIAEIEGYTFKHWILREKDGSWDMACTKTVSTKIEDDTTIIAVYEKTEAKYPAAGGMVLVKGGTFQMGNTRNDSEGDSDEKPVHTVTLTYDYWMGNYEVTFNEYDTFCAATGRSKPNDRGWGRGTRPVINVTWWDAIAYCNWLSEKEGIAKAYDSSGNLLDRNGNRTTDITQVEGYRLPTEAEWEFAARGGQNTKGYKYAGSDTLSEVGWYSGNSGNKTHPVGEKRANELGICDMSGNVWEWCTDWKRGFTTKTEQNPIGASGNYLVPRGAGWYSPSQHGRVSFRGEANPWDSTKYLGFRVARTVEREQNAIYEQITGKELLLSESFDNSNINDSILLGHGMGNPKTSKQGLKYYAYASLERYLAIPILVEKEGREALLFDIPESYHGFITIGDIFEENENKDFTIMYDFYLKKETGRNILSFYLDSIGNGPTPTLLVGYGFQSSKSLSVKNVKKQIYYFETEIDLFDSWHTFEMSYKNDTKTVAIYIDTGLLWEGELEFPLLYQTPYFGNGQGPSNTYVTKVYYDNLKIYRK